MVAKPFNVPEAAEELGATTDQVHAWIKSGELDAWNVSTDPDPQRCRWKISPESILDFKERRSAVAIAQRKNPDRPPAFRRPLPCKRHV